MSFQHPEFLYYMLPPIFILFGLLLTQKEAQATFFSPEVMEKLRVSANTLTLKARNALFMLMAIMIVIALAGPVIKDGEVEVKAKSADIMIALDISDSMLAKDVYPNRLKMAKKKALDLLKLAPNERIGVIAFAKNSYLVSPLSFDHSAVSFLLRQLDTNSITEKGTDMLSMLEVVQRSINKDSKKYLLLLSDGGDAKDFTKEIAYAKENEIAVFVLGIGTKKGAPIKLENGAFIKKNGEIIVTKLNQEIATLATKTGGVYIENVKSDEDVKAMLREIEAHSEQKELKSEKVERFIPLFYYPLGFALLLLLIATSSMSKREKVALPSAFLLFGLLFSNQNLEAGMLDFMELDEAKKAYDAGDYAKSQKIYSKHAKSTQNAQSMYNAANALYKQKKYDEAIKTYNQAHFSEDDARAKTQANIGNAYAKKADAKSLQKAVEAYEKSLKIQEDKQTRENLEAVKKVLEKQKQEKKKQKDKKNKDSKKDKNNKDKKDSQDKQKSEQKQKSDQKQQSDKKDSKQDKENKSQKDEQKKQDAQKNEMNSKQDKEKKDASQKKKEELKQLQDEKQKKDKKNKQEKNKQQMAASQQDKMSDAEEQKWLKQLNKQQSTFMYMLNKNNKLEEDSNEMPW
jgi:Ca-activated chloride channel family protein